MSFGSQTHRPIAQLKAVRNPTTRNIVSPVAANTEFSITLTASVKRFSIKCREKETVQFCFVSGESNTIFNTLHFTQRYGEVNIESTGLTLYLQTTGSSVTIELLEWI